MSKTSKNLKNSKTGKKQAVKKSAKKSDLKALEKRMEEAARPVPFSFREDNYGRHLTDTAQLTLIVLGFFSFGFAVAEILTVINDFIVENIDAEVEYTLFDYFNTCQPEVACRVADSAKVLTVLPLIIAGSICLKMALTNTHSKRRTIRVMRVMLVIAAVAYIVGFILNRVVDWGVA